MIQIFLLLKSCQFNFRLCYVSLSIRGWARCRILFATSVTVKFALLDYQTLKSSKAEVNSSKKNFCTPHDMPARQLWTHVNITYERRKWNNSEKLLSEQRNRIVARLDEHSDRRLKKPGEARWKNTNKNENSSCYKRLQDFNIPWWV